MTLVINTPCCHTGGFCIGNHLCEVCKNPHAYGYFLTTDKMGRTKWEQRFILRKDLELIQGYYDTEISRLQKLKDSLSSIPVKESV